MPYTTKKSAAFILSQNIAGGHKSALMRWHAVACLATGGKSRRAAAIRRKSRQSAAIGGTQAKRPEVLPPINNRTGYVADRWVKYKNTGQYTRRGVR